MIITALCLCVLLLCIKTKRCFDTWRNSLDGKSTHRHVTKNSIILLSVQKVYLQNNVCVQNENLMKVLFLHVFIEKKKSWCIQHSNYYSIKTLITHSQPKTFALCTNKCNYK